jgi:hypothetical protein
MMRLRATQSPFTRMRRVHYQVFEQLAPLGAMTVAIEFDVPIDVVDEMAQAIVVMPSTIERVEEPAEHLRDEVFAAVEQRWRTASPCNCPIAPPG